MNNFSFSFVFFLFSTTFAILSLMYFKEKETFNYFVACVCLFMISKHACDYYFKQYKLENDKNTSKHI